MTTPLPNMNYSKPLPPLPPPYDHHHTYDSHYHHHNPTTTTIPSTWSANREDECDIWRACGTLCTGGSAFGGRTRHTVFMTPRLNGDGSSKDVKQESGCSEQYMSTLLQITHGYCSQYSWRTTPGLTTFDRKGFQTGSYRCADTTLLDPTSNGRYLQPTDVTYRPRTESGGVRKQADDGDERVRT